MERVSVSGRRYQVQEDKIDDSAPDAFQESRKEQSLVKTAVGYFILDELQNIKSQVPPMQVIDGDMDEYEYVGDVELDFIRRSRDLLFKSDTPSVYQVEDTYYIDMTTASDQLGFDTETDEIIVEVTDKVSVNEESGGNDSLSFLGKEYDYNAVGGSTNTDYPDRKSILVLRRSDDNKLRQTAIVSEETLDELVMSGALYDVEIVS